MANLPRVDFNDLADDDVRTVKDEGLRSALYRVTEKIKKVFAYHDSLLSSSTTTSTSTETSSTPATLTALGSAGTITPVSYPLVLSASQSGKVFLVSTAAARTIKFPKAAAGLIFTIKDATGTASTYNITMSRLSGVKVDNVDADYVIKQNYGVYTFISDGTNWFIAASAMSEEGSFAATLSGFVSTVNITVNYWRFGNVVTLYFPDTTATSNTTAMVLSSLPTALQPTRSQQICLTVFNGATAVAGYAWFYYAAAADITFGVGLATSGATAFTASSLKGIERTTITYVLN